MTIVIDHRSSTDDMPVSTANQFFIRWITWIVAYFSGELLFLMGQVNYVNGGFDAASISS